MVWITNIEGEGSNPRTEEKLSIENIAKRMGCLFVPSFVPKKPSH